MSIRTHQEVELKLALPDEGAWAALREALGAPRSVSTQVNTYFDTRQQSLRRSRQAMVRVREENGTIEVTVKDRVEGADAGRLRSRERSDTLSAADWSRVQRGECPLTALDAALCRTLAEEVGDALYPLGSAVNRREEYALGGGYVAEVDRTELPGGRIDFEVELELRQPAHTLEGARDALDAAAPTIDVAALGPSTPKYARFLEALDTTDTL